MELKRVKYRIGCGEWIGIVGLVVALLAWWHSTKTRDVSVRVSPIVVEVVKSGVASDLSIFYLGMPITSDLRAYQIAVWNGGREPVRREDVLKPLTLSWSTNNRVVEIKVVKSTRGEAEFTMNSVDYEARVAKFDWRILENADGGLIQLLVQGAERPVLSVSGTIVGQDRIQTELTGPAAIQQGNGRSFTKWVMRFAFPIFCVAAVVFGFRESKSLYKCYVDKPRRLRAVFIALIQLMASLILLALCGFITWAVYLPESPFDF
jgi:hypothetical protein